LADVNMTSPSSLKYSLAALVTYAVCFEALAIVVLVGSQAAAHARYLDVAWAAGFAVIVAGPMLIALGLPATLLVAALVWRRRHSTGPVRVLVETGGITLAVWSAWGTTLVLLGIGFAEVSMRFAAASVLFLALAGVVPAVATAWLLHAGKLDRNQEPVW
jgi:hypothetical protein